MPPPPSTTPQRDLWLFFTLATGFAWLCWLSAPLLGELHTAVSYFLVRLGLFGPALAGWGLVYAATTGEENNKTDKSHAHLITRGLLFLVLFGLTLYLLTWQKMAGNSIRFTPAIFMADTLLSLLVATLLTNHWSLHQSVATFFRPLWQWRVNPIWYLFALLLLPAVAYSTLFLLEGAENLADFFLRPLGAMQVGDVLLLFLLSALVGGPLGEELGWRGYALPRLQQLYNDTTSSLWLGGVWTLWHLPLYVTGVYHGRVDEILLRFFWTIPLAFLFTYLHRRTNGSILLAMLLHTSFNIAPFSLHPYNLIWLLLLASLAHLHLRHPN